MSKSGKTLCHLAAGVATVALIAIGAGGATASAREPELTTVNAVAMPLNNQPKPVDRNWYAQNGIKLYRTVEGAPVYPEAVRTAVRGIVVNSDGVSCNSKMATITVSKNGAFTFNSKLVSTELAANGIGITTHANRPLTIIVSTGGMVKVAQVPVGAADGRKFVLHTEDWVGDRKFVLHNGEWVEKPNFPSITFCG